MDIDAIAVRLGQSIRDALEVINSLDGGSCLVVDEDGRLRGIVSDGDVRRGLLGGVTLETPARDIMSTEPTVAPSSATREELLAIMQAHDIRDLPVVGDDGTLVAVRTMKELLAAGNRDNWVVLMAGGLGQRLRPLTEITPKPMLEIEGRPILESIVLKLIGQGFRKFYLSVNYLSHMVKQHFEYGDRWGVEIRYLEEDKPLGTGGALGLIKEPPDGPLVLMNGDVLTNLDVGQMIDFHVRSKAVATVGVIDHEIQLPYGVFTVQDAHATAFREKPVLSYSINGGVYVVEPAVLKLVEKGAVVDMPDIIMDCLQRAQPVAAYHISESWLDIGEHSQLERARRDAAIQL